MEQEPELEETAGDSPGVSWWGILAGAVVGVGAVAAAPFTGGGSVIAGTTLAASLAGAGTVAAAAGAGATGAVAGSVVGASSRRRTHDDGRREGEMKAKAECDRKIERLTAQLEEFVGMVKDREAFFDAVLAMTAVGMATANCDGEIHEAERKSIELFISGLSAAKLPGKVKTGIEEMYKAPPDLRTAFKAAREANIPTDLVDEIIEVVIHADDVVHREEQAFLAALRRLKSAA